MRMIWPDAAWIARSGRARLEASREADRPRAGGRARLAVRGEDLQTAVAREREQRRRTASGRIFAHLTSPRQLDELRARVEAPAQLGEGQALAEQDAAFGVGRHQVERSLVGGEPEDAIAAELLAELEGGQGVEIVALGHQEHLADLLQLGLATLDVDAELGLPGVQS